jgi:hypothetical protein
MCENAGSWTTVTDQPRPLRTHSRCLERERTTDGQADRERTGDRSPLGPPLRESGFSGSSRAIPRRRSRPRKTTECLAMTPSNGNDMEMIAPGS